MKFLLCLLVMGIASSLYAQVYKGVSIVHASLLTGTMPGAKPFTLGIRLKMEPGWHTYWKNPGDAGLPLSVEAVEPKGITLGELRFPTPHKLSTGDVATYGYEDEVIYLLPVKPSDAASAKHFKLKLSWLVCKEVCLPGEATLEFNADSLQSDQLKENQHQLDRWTARLPQPGAGFNLDKAGATYSVEKNGKLKVTMKFFEVAPGTVTDFFPEEIPDFVIDYSSINVTPDVVSMIVEPSTPTATLKTISGLAMIGTSGYEVSVPASKQ